MNNIEKRSSDRMKPQLDMLLSKNTFRTVVISFCCLLTNPLFGQHQDGAGLFGAGGDESPAPIIKPVPGDLKLLGSIYLDPHVPIEERITDLMSKMTDEEKCFIFYGGGELATGNFKRLGIPTIGLADGPQGVRLSKGIATGFPVGIAMASTWNTSLIKQVGKAIGEECLAFNRRVIFGPGVNIMRSPLGGRNYEYMGEDPLLTGKIAAAYIKGTQSVGVASCPKHWVLNDQEVRRNTINITCDERALHEIYAKSFEIIQRDAKPWAVMTSNSMVFGMYASESKPILEQLLFKEIGFDGAVISDWAAVHNGDKAINAGCTLIMPTNRNSARAAQIIERIKTGSISREAFEDGIRRMLRLYFRVGAFDLPKQGAANTPEHQQLAREVATESIVLLKNKGNILPLNAGKLKKIAIIGPNADFYHTMADDPGAKLWDKGGSGAVRPPYEITPLAALRAALGNKIIYAPGYTFATEKQASVNDISSAVAAAREADVAIIFAGINHQLDGEGRGWDSEKANDRKDLELIGPQKELIDAVMQANANTIVVLTNGSPVSLESWNDQVPCIVEAWYGNQESGNAIKDILLGNANPSGKLPCTLAKNLEDYRVHQFDQLAWPGTGKNGQLDYKESIWVGYRWFDHAKITPLYPFGHGLSYTNFSYESMTVKQNTDKNTYSVKVKLRNAGKITGKEVVEFYVIPPQQNGLERPEKELKAFAKIELVPGETKTVVATIEQDAFSYYDVGSKSWNRVPGTYTIAAGSSSRDIRLLTPIKIR